MQKSTDGREASDNITVGFSITLKLIQKSTHGIEGGNITTAGFIVIRVTTFSKSNVEKFPWKKRHCQYHSLVEKMRIDTDCKVNAEKYLEREGSDNALLGLTIIGRGTHYKVNAEKHS